ncbi:sigma-54 dependent transcriptional regulator [Thalassobacillus sp. C254]|uniref:sigma-54-dependent transcriptional regulator n=1 Tax=Thalassobacillus sp. C254 TaxID=1225341 RepID=UPI0006D255BA|nr:sigma-54 dependent transcriptional regulator [Thalassobacillus sp. C254]
MKNILIIDDEREICTFLSHLLTLKTYHVTTGLNGDDFYKHTKAKQFDLAILDVRLPDADGLTLLRELKREQPSCKTLIMTGYSTVKTAVDAIKSGANDFIEKPFDDIDKLEEQIDGLLENGTNQMEKHVQSIADQAGFFLGRSEAMRHLAAFAYKIAQKQLSVLIEGETGSGKEVLARFIHMASHRSKERFIGVNCGALSEQLLESELFGHEKGAFTGAVETRRGLFELASQGTLFLDEIAEATPQTQVKLLRVLEAREYYPVGSEKVKRTNARILAASHKDLQEAVKEKAFREDLLYRLNVVKLTIPPLRERVDDLEELTAFLVSQSERPDMTVSSEAMSVMKKYHWPGNIRELSNVISRAIALADEETTMIPVSLLPHTFHESPAEKEAGAAVEIPQKKESSSHSTAEFERYLQEWTSHVLSLWRQEEPPPLEEVLDKVKELEQVTGQAFVEKTLQQTYGNRREAARQLDITMRKIRYILNEKGTPSSG